MKRALLPKQKQVLAQGNGAKPLVGAEQRGHFEQTMQGNTC